MNIVLETERLVLRTFTLEDAPLLFELNSDPSVTVYTLDLMKDMATAEKVLKESIIPQYGLYHHGRWAVHLKSHLEFLGWCGLKYHPERDEVDLGYRFRKLFWGKGYATEAARACIDFGFHQLDLQKIIGRALPGNLASIRVLEKTGMTYAGEETIDGLLHKTYHAIHPAITPRHL